MTSPTLVHPRALAMVSPAWPPGVLANGIVSYSARLCGAFREAGVDACVLAWRLGEDAGEPWVLSLAAEEGPRTLLERATGMVRYQLRPNEERRRRRAAMLRSGLHRVCAQRRVQIVQMEESAGLAGAVAGSSPVPIVVRLHGPWFLNGPTNGVARDRAFHWRVAMERQSIEAAHGITAPSRDVLERTRAFYDLPLPDAAVIPNPIGEAAAADRWDPQRCERDRIIFVGRFDRHKGGDVAIDAFRQLASSRPMCRLTLVGPDAGVRDAAGRLWRLNEYLDHHVPNPAVRARIDVLGQCSQEQIRRLRKQAMVTIVPSRYETFGNTALEAMAAGCPLVASRVGGLAEIVQHDRNGLFADVGNAADLARQVAVVLDNPATALRLSQQAQVDCAARHSPGVIARQTLDYYAEVLAQRSAGARAGSSILVP